MNKLRYEAPAKSEYTDNYFYRFSMVRTSRDRVVLVKDRVHDFSISKLKNKKSICRKPIYSYIYVVNKANRCVDG